jgi:hypothetical protein
MVLAMARSLHLQLTVRFFLTGEHHAVLVSGACVLWLVGEESRQVLVTAWSWPGHGLVTAWSWPGHGLVTAWSWPGHGLVTAVAADNLEA